MDELTPSKEASFTDICGGYARELMELYEEKEAQGAPLPTFILYGSDPSVDGYKGAMSGDTETLYKMLYTLAEKNPTFKAVLKAVVSTMD